ncbi:hypothetical protein MJA45_02940 [Paenibacillus aurantius]|uniref:DUF3052 domain-containing protein n=1 Tax=Paenibacillus aurantius TaxID=2918900 RepID=A0AA96LFE2_9BACL|nr:hypothetical protein [Paenibacillus aurantius]WNQ12033.1 hypothetical protein MJA45_02940 [Paenibacillus aurantius]
MQEELLKKLKYKEGRALVLNAPEGYRLGVEEEGSPEGTYPFVQLFVNDSSEVEKWVPETVPFLAEDAVFWITYPKQSSKIKTDVNRDRLWSLVEGKAPYRPVSNVAVDDTWSALRFRHVDKVKPKK